MKHTALIITLLFTLLLLTACHTDNDPWPATNGLDTPTATSAATEQPVYTEEPATIQAPAVTAEPTATPEPTEVPGGSEDSGING